MRIKIEKDQISVKSGVFHRSSPNLISRIPKVQSVSLKKFEFNLLKITHVREKTWVFRKIQNLMKSEWQYGFFLNSILIFFNINHFIQICSCIFLQNSKRYKISMCL